MLAPVDLEAAACAYLAEHVGVTATSVLNPRPPDDTFLRITRAGGQGRNLVQSDIRLLVEAWAPDEVDAFNLARLAYAHLWAAQFGRIGEVLVMAIELTEPTNYPDPALPEASRYQFIATATVGLQDIQPDSQPNSQTA